MNLKFIFFGLSFLTAAIVSDSFAADNEFVSCGPGYILVDKGQTDGIDTSECQKLWCTDLENDKSMGSENSPATGYKSTTSATELCDASAHCIECWGDRKWCSNEPRGIWNPEYGAYTKGGADTAGYVSYQKGGCFAWQLEKPNCPEDQTALFKGGEWTCVITSSTSTGSRESGVRRTGTVLKKQIKK